MFNPLRFWWASVALTAIILSGCANAKTPKAVNCACPSEEKSIQNNQAADLKGGKAALPAAILPMLVESHFSELSGWASSNHEKLLETFAKQCSADTNALAKRKATPVGLMDACQKARGNLNHSTPLPAKTWLENNFQVWQFQQEDGKKEGLLTGYFEPLLKGARKAQGAYNVPLFGVPSDLINIQLDKIYPELKGKRLRGRLQGDLLVPFFSRAEWEQIGSRRETPLVWVNDKLDAFLLQVQGSGRIQLQEGGELRLSYADQNGHPYQSIGKVLVDRGELTAEQATIPGIRNWAQANPSQLDWLLNTNPSVVFFKENKILNPQDGPIGAMGIPLTEQLSLAIDREKVPYGSLMWIESIDPNTKKPLAQGALAQDTGGAIRGRIRADYFWGTGAKAGQAAGITRQPLKLWLIWPKGTPLPEGGS